MDIESATQKRICAWCEKVMGEKKTEKPGDTHGICRKCMKKHFPEDYAALHKAAATYDSKETDALMTKQLSERDDYRPAGDSNFFHDYPENSSDVRPWSPSRNQQELWNRFKEWWREKWYGKDEEKRKIGREEPLNREDRFHETEDQSGSEGFWEYKNTPYTGNSQSPTFFNAMPAMKIGTLDADASLPIGPIEKAAVNEYANHHVSITFEFMADEIKVVCTWDKEDLPSGLSEEQTLARLVSFLERKLPAGIAHFKNAQVKNVDLINRMVGIIIPIGRINE